MSNENLDWLRKSGEKAETNRQRNQAIGQQMQSRHDSETKAFEKAMSSLRNSWEKLNVDSVLSGIKNFLGGDEVSRMETYDSHDSYYLDLNRPPDPPRLSKSIYKHYECDDGWGGTATIADTLFSISFSSRGYCVRYFVNSPPKRVIDKNLGIPKDESELKEKLDKFLSSII